MIVCYLEGLFTAKYFFFEVVNILHGVKDLSLIRCQVLRKWKWRFAVFLCFKKTMFLK